LAFARAAVNDLSSAGLHCRLQSYVRRKVTCVGYRWVGNVLNSFWGTLKNNAVTAAATAFLAVLASFGVYVYNNINDFIERRAVDLVEKIASDKIIDKKSKLYLNTVSLFNELEEKNTAQLQSIM
ncbi:MAG: hypothetical protein C0490_19955, partial [Marivirga sp.]|nr:hypothetical protein [Marivirga sp.]